MGRGWCTHEYTYNSSEKARRYLSNHCVQKEQEECSGIDKVDYFDKEGLFKVLTGCKKPSPAKLVYKSG